MGGLRRERAAASGGTGGARGPGGGWLVPGIAARALVGRLAWATSMRGALALGDDVLAALPAAMSSGCEGESPQTWGPSRCLCVANVHAIVASLPLQGARPYYTAR